MSTVLENPVATGGGVERWFFTAIAAEFLVIVVLGFAPTSVDIITGEMTVSSPIVHLHAALMLSWMLAFLTQAYLIAAGRLQQHIRVGRIMFTIGLMIAASFVYFSLFWPGEGFGRINTPMAAERVGLFSLFLLLAFANRRTDSESHKRYILLATLVPLDAALNRMPWLPAFGLDWATPVWVLLILGQLVAFDWYRFGRVHSATLIGGGMVSVFWLGMILWLIFYA